MGTLKAFANCRTLSGFDGFPVKFPGFSRCSTPWAPISQRLRRKFQTASLPGCVYFGAAVFVDEFRDEEDVVSAREDGEGENGGVDGWEVPARTVRNAGGEDDCGDREDLYRRVDFPKH